MSIKPVRSIAQYRLALRRLDSLMDAKPGTRQADEAQVLYLLVAAFENQYVELPAVTPTAAIEFRMHQLGLTRRDMIPYFGTESRVSEVLNGKRKLTVDMIAALHYGLGIPFESLIRLSAGDARRFGKLRHEPVARLKAFRMRLHPQRRRGRPPVDKTAKAPGRLPRAISTEPGTLLPADKKRLRELLKTWKAKNVKPVSPATPSAAQPRYEKARRAGTVRKKVRKPAAGKGIISLPKRKK